MRRTGSFSLNPENGRSCAVHEDLAQVAVAALADAEQPCLSVGRVLSRHKPQPGCELTTLMEGITVADSGHYRRGDQRTDAGDLP
jgi:hypothetical protein